MTGLGSDLCGRYGGSYSTRRDAGLSCKRPNKQRLTSQSGSLPPHNRNLHFPALDLRQRLSAGEILGNCHYFDHNLTMFPKLDVEIRPGVGLGQFELGMP